MVDVFLELRGVTKAYARAGTVVDDLSLDVPTGRRVVLMGRSGAGKTTLLRIVAGLERPERGVVRLDGRDLTGVAPADRDIALVRQDDALFPHWTVRGNLAFPLRARGTESSAVDRRVREVATLLRIDPLLARMPSELSGGERRRVSLGRALVRHPKLLLLDEPLTGLDWPLRADLQQAIADAQTRLAVTTLYVTHHAPEAMLMADRLGFLDRGRLLQFDHPRLLYERPVDVAVGRGTGEGPLNCVHGCVEKHVFVARDDRTWTLQVGDAATVTAPRDGAAVLGFRSELLYAVGEGETWPCRISGKVDNCHFAGSYWQLRVQTPVGSMVGRSSVPEGVGSNVTLGYRGTPLLWYADDAGGAS